MPKPEADVFHMSQLRAVLAACNPKVPQEETAVRILIGSGLRASELCGLALMGPDGLSDIMTDSMVRGRVELRVRWDGGAKGLKSRRVPITPKLATAIKRYEGRYRPEVAHGELLINGHRRPYRRYGIDAMMDRLQRRVGFRVHAHAFRRIFATVATKLGWNFRAPARGDGPRGLQGAPAIRSARDPAWADAANGWTSSSPIPLRTGRKRWSTMHANCEVQTERPSRQPCRGWTGRS